MNLKQILIKIAVSLFKSNKKDTIEKCGCPCHKDQPWISHFRPCCKYSGQPLK